MEAQPDFRDLLALLNARGVEYVVVGAHALAYHGAPRLTGDLDILVRPDAENARRVLGALEEFGFGAIGLAAEDFVVPDRVVQLGIVPVRIDLVTSITAVPWQEAAAGCAPGVYGDVPVRYLGRAELVKNKRAIGRKKDIADLEALGEA